MFLRTEAAESSKQMSHDYFVNIDIQQPLSHHIVILPFSSSETQARYDPHCEKLVEEVKSSLEPTSPWHVHYINIFVSIQFYVFYSK